MRCCGVPRTCFQTQGEAPSILPTTALHVAPCSQNTGSPSRGSEKESRVTTFSKVSIKHTPHTTRFCRNTRAVRLAILDQPADDAWRVQGDHHETSGLKSPLCFILLHAPYTSMSLFWADWRSRNLSTAFYYSVCCYVHQAQVWLISIHHIGKRHQAYLGFKQREVNRFRIIIPHFRIAREIQSQRFYGESPQY